MLKIRNYRFAGWKGVVFLIVGLLVAGLAISLLPFVLGAGLGYLAYRRIMSPKARNITVGTVAVLSLIVGIPWASAFWGSDTTPSVQITAPAITNVPPQEPTLLTDQAEISAETEIKADAATAVETATAAPAVSSPSPTVAGVSTQAVATPAATSAPKTSPVATTKATPTAAPPPTPASTPTHMPTPTSQPGGSCSADLYSCGDFSSCAEAMAVFNSCSGDPHRLDGNKDGVPCEDLCS